jgi:hypothetical protein
MVVEVFFAPCQLPKSNTTYLPHCTFCEGNIQNMESAMKNNVFVYIAFMMCKWKNAAYSYEVK